jgi:HEPN domain.
VSSKEAELLKRRAIAFLKNAQQLYTQEVYDLAAFNLEQHCELLLKYLLFLL